MIYVVDDEQSITETVCYALQKEGHDAVSFPNGVEALNAFQKRRPDCIILDIMMPQMDGLELCRKIRSQDELTPIIFLSSRDEELDRIIGLEMGGDDYLCKPFSVRELLVRIKVILRRLNKNPGEAQQLTAITTGSLSLEPETGQCHWKGEKVPLTLSEIRILEALIKNPGVIKTREQLMQSAFPEDMYINERAADSHIKRLRKKITLSDPLFDNIETVYGMGYRYRNNA